MNKINPATLDELLETWEQNPSQFQHLKIFMRCYPTNDKPKLGEDFLVVSARGYGIFRVEDIEYEDGKIKLSLVVKSTNETVKYYLDINNEQPICLFIRWVEIKNLVLADIKKKSIQNNDLLQLIK